MTNDEKPKGHLVTRMLAMPKDTNINGDIFGGWVVSQMDIAGAAALSRYTPHGVVTAGINSMSFIAPIHVGDFVCCYAFIQKIGRTSVAVNIEAWAISNRDLVRHRVTEGIFTYVAIDENGKPTPVDRERILAEEKLRLDN